MEIRKITPQELYERLEKEKDTFILDVRASEKFRDDHIEHSQNIPKTAIFENDEQAISTLPNQSEIIITCTTGNSATKCATILSEKNYQVTVIEGGITAWKEYVENQKK